LQRRSNRDQLVQERHEEHGKGGREERTTRGKETEGASKRTKAHKMIIVNVVERPLQSIPGFSFMAGYLSESA
jgi:hypothetical protein